MSSHLTQDYIQYLHRHWTRSQIPDSLGKTSHWPPWDNILVLNIWLLCSNRSGINSHGVTDERKRKKSIFSISTSAESDFPECFEPWEGVSRVGGHVCGLHSPDSLTGGFHSDDGVRCRTIPMLSNRTPRFQPRAQQFSCSAPYLQCLSYVFVHSLFWKSGFQLLVHSSCCLQLFGLGHTCGQMSMSDAKGASL